jgi:transposase
MSETILAVKKENEELRKAVSNLELTLKHQQHRIDQLLRKLYGIKSEKLPPQPPSLFSELPFTEEELAANTPTEPVKQAVSAHTRKVKKKDPTSLRYEFPEHLRREEIVIEPSEIPDGAVKIGEEISEKLEVTKSELYVRRTIRPKYAKADKSGVVIADLPESPVYRCMAGLSLLVRILVDKYVDHLPLYRQIERYARQGVKLKDSTICDWVSQVAKLLEILYKELTNEVLSSGYIGADETPIKVLDPKVQGKCHQGQMWVYLAHDKNLVKVDYDPTHKHSVPTESLKNFSGYLQSDGYGAYKQFDNRKDVVHLGCMAHARRKFDESKDNDSVRSLKALAMMQRIYRLEALMGKHKSTCDRRRTLRQLIAVPLLNELFDWMEKEYPQTTPKSAIGRAISYSLERKTQLMAYTGNGMLHIDNNPVENKIRPMAIGKKNYMFMGSHEAAQRSAMLYSFFLSCKLNQIDPEMWLADVLSRIQITKASELHTLLPNQWVKP